MKSYSELEKRNKNGRVFYAEREREIKKTKERKIRISRRKEIKKSKRGNKHEPEMARPEVQIAKLCARVYSKKYHNL